MTSHATIRASLIALITFFAILMISGLTAATILKADTKGSDSSSSSSSGSSKSNDKDNDKDNDNSNTQSSTSSGSPSGKGSRTGSGSNPDASSDVTSSPQGTLPNPTTTFTSPPPNTTPSASESSSSSSNGGSTTHCDSPGYPSCSSLGSEAGKNAPGTSCPPGHSKAFCKAYNTAAGSPAASQLVNTPHCDAPGYPPCYSLGYADGKNHPGTSCPSGHSQNYCNGYRAGAGSSFVKNNTNGSTSAQADVAHCDQKGWPSCYSVGYEIGKAHPGTICPPGHSASFCSGWNAAAGNTAHCGSAGYPSCYSLGFADGLQHLGASCPSGHTPNYCAGWNAAAGNTAHCDQPGWPSCYDVGYQAGKNAPGSSCPPGHTVAFCNGYVTGTRTTPLLDIHCDTSGYPSCYSLGYQAGKNAPGAPCPSGHSMNYCSGWEVGSRLKVSEIIVTDASYKTAKDTPIGISLSAKDSDPTAKVTISVVSQPAHGNLKSAGAGNHYTYTPNFENRGPLFNYDESLENSIKKELPFLNDRNYFDYIHLCYLDTLGYVKRQKSKDARKLFSILIRKYFNVINSFFNTREDLGLRIGNAKIVRGDARDLQKCAGIEDESIDGIISSPPYSFAIDYLKGDKSQLEFLGVNLENLNENMIGLRGRDGSDKVSKYLQDMKKILGEMYRVLKNDRFAVILIGTNTSQLLKVSEYLNKVRLEDELVRIGEEVGFSLNQRIIRPIEGIRNSIRNEEILFLRK